MNDQDFIGWTCGTRLDAEDFAREVAADHGLTRSQVVIRPAEYGWDVFARTARADLCAPADDLASYADLALRSGGA